MVAALALIGAACGDDDDSDTGEDTTTGEETTAGSETAGEETAGEETTGGEAAAGGTLVVAAEQEPECADFIASCAGASWGVWSIGVHTLPRAYDQINGEYVPSPLLAGEPTLDTTDGQVVTYEINPDAVWSDGTPITSEDFEYTWSQIATGEDIYDATGYANMVSVDSSDPAKAVVTFDPPFATWKDMFGGFYGVLPKHILCGEDTAVADCSGEDRNAGMNDGYDWSGGPWIATWNKGSDVTLTPNENYWGTMPKIDTVVMKFIEDTSAQIQALKAKEVSAANPQPQLELGAQLGDDPDIQVDVNVATTFLEALWINMAEEPWTDKAVRQALAYTLDRDAVVAALFGDLGVESASQSLIQPAAELYVNDAFSAYSRDLDKVDELMTGAGWAKNGDGFWEKDGTVAEVPIATTEGNQRRETTQDAMQAALEEAGFKMSPDNSDAATLFGERGPASDFSVSLWATVGTQSPEYCALFCTKNIPGPENDNAGQNWTQTSVAALDEVLEAAETELDEETRIEQYQTAQEIMAEEVVAIPIDPLPEIAIHDTSVVTGPIGPNAVYSLYWNLNEWELVG